MNWEKADDVKELLQKISSKLNFKHIDTTRVFAVRSKGSTARAYARIWSLPMVWQQCLEIQAHYVIEVLSEKFDPLSQEEKEKVLIHELLHIPKTFSGALVPHKCFGKMVVNKRAVDKLHKQYKQESFFD